MLLRMLTDKMHAHESPASLYSQLCALECELEAAAAAKVETWQSWDLRPHFAPSALNLAAYLALRQHDLRALQRELMRLGLSSLGRLESRVFPTLAAVRGALAAIAGVSHTPAELKMSDPEPHAFFAGERTLEARTRELFGPAPAHRNVALLITCPTEAATDPSFMMHLAEQGVEAVRINCAHDSPAEWAQMIEHAREAAKATGRQMRIHMDLAGPKIRTGKSLHMHEAKKLSEGDTVVLVPPGALDGCKGEGKEKGEGKKSKKNRGGDKEKEHDEEDGSENGSMHLNGNGHHPWPADADHVCECTLPEVFSAAKVGHRVFIDDGKISAVIERAQSEAHDGSDILPHLVLRILRCKEGGAKLKAEKGLNFPDTDLRIPALTEKDRHDLVFVAHNADMIGFSFVQSAEDVAELQEALESHRPTNWESLGVILKIETAKAVRNLPDIVVRSAARQPTGIMIARGDLAIELGFTRMAEMQEEILWIGEAAQVPVIWATQVLEGLVKEGLPSRGEITDAAMAGRAECVMLNKGPFLLDAIRDLDVLLAKMDDHVHKKTPQLRRLGSW